MNDLFFKFCGDSLAGHSGEEGSRNNELNVEDTAPESFYLQ